MLSSHLFIDTYFSFNIFFFLLLSSFYLFDSIENFLIKTLNGLLYAFEWLYFAFLFDTMFFTLSFILIPNFSFNFIFSLFIQLFSLSLLLFIWSSHHSLLLSCCSVNKVFVVSTLNGIKHHLEFRHFTVVQKTIFLFLVVFMAINSLLYQFWKILHQLICQIDFFPQRNQRCAKFNAQRNNISNCFSGFLYFVFQYCWWKICVNR